MVKIKLKDAPAFLIIVGLLFLVASIVSGEMKGIPIIIGIIIFGIFASLINSKRRNEYFNEIKKIQEKDKKNEELIEWAQKENEKIQSEKNTQNLFIKNPHRVPACEAGAIRAGNILSF